MKAQHEMVLEWLLEHGTITALQAREMFGIMQMPRRIYNLRRMGWKIRSVMRTGRNRLGAPVVFAVYTLEGGKK